MRPGLTCVGSERNGSAGGASWCQPARGLLREDCPEVPILETSPPTGVFVQIIASEGRLAAIIWTKTPGLGDADGPRPCSTPALWPAFGPVPTLKGPACGAPVQRPA